MHVPDFVVRVQRELSRYEGLCFRTEYDLYDGDLNLTVSNTRSVSGYCEAIARTVIEGVEGCSNVTHEPNGENTFPDLGATLDCGGAINFEVKSWRSKNRSWQGASCEQLNSALRRGDPVYLNSWYIDFDLTEESDGRVRINAITLGRIWEFCTGSGRTGRGKVGLSSGHKMSSSPKAFLYDYLAKEIKLGRYPHSRKYDHAKRVLARVV